MPHHERPHHLIVLVRQNVAMVDVAREFYELVLRNLKVRVTLLIFIIASRCPANPQNCHRVGINQISIFPSPFVGRDRTRCIAADVLVPCVPFAALDQVGGVPVVGSHRVESGVAVDRHVFETVTLELLEEREDLFVFESPDVLAEVAVAELHFGQP